MEGAKSDSTVVSVIIAVYNASEWLDEAFESILKQDFEGKVEVSVYDDASTDSSLAMVYAWHTQLAAAGIKLIVGSAADGIRHGVGYARNRAVEQSTGNFLCFFDADDVMFTTRIRLQYELSCLHGNSIVGSQFVRDPLGSTDRYTRWANSLTESQLYTQVYTSHGPTVIMPTWFCSRAVYDSVGGFDESGHGTPEDLLFFYRHLALRGELARVDHVLLSYRYHTSAASFSVLESTIWRLRVATIEQTVLSRWSVFTIWNAGKQGRRFYRSLSADSRAKVSAFCDVDMKKISRGVYVYEDSSLRPKPAVPVFDFRQAKPPFIICVKLDLTAGDFERNLASLKLREGVDYFHFN